MMQDFNYSPRRSVLYIPGSNQRALEKAKQIQADAFIFDLEDAVAPEAKPQARSQAVAAAKSGTYEDKELTIRCNPTDTPWGIADIEAIATSGANAIVVPKVASPQHIDEVLQRLDESGGDGSMRIWAMVETPSALLEARAIASHPRVSALIMGTNDLINELRLKPTPSRSGLVPYLAMTVLAAREAGKDIIDGVFNDIKDLATLQLEAQQGFEMGFDGKTLIHPSQVEPINQIWAPSAAEIEHAKNVIEAFEQAQARGEGVATVDGQMIENLHRDRANRVLAIAQALG